MNDVALLRSNRAIPCRVWSVVLLSALCAIFWVSLLSGPTSVPIREGLLALADTVFDSSMSGLDNFQKVVILELRLPRALLAMAVGAILAQCGAVMQGLFRNPLADPGIIGVSSGAAMGAVLAIALFSSVQAAVFTPVFAFMGGLLTTIFVYTLARSSQGTSVLMLLLAGVAISAFGGALIGMLSYFADDQKLRALSLWQMGRVADASHQNLIICFSTMALLAAYFQSQAPKINALILGEAEARHLGVNVEALKLRLIVVTALGVGVAVASAGIIGFVGLIVPHFVRLLVGPNYVYLLPFSAMAGALLLLAADLLARSLVQPAEIPVGIVTALLGAPFFLVLLNQQRKGGAA
jgi:heme transport system permease protein